METEVPAQVRDLAPGDMVRLPRPHSPAVVVVEGMRELEDEYGLGMQLIHLSWSSDTYVHDLVEGRTSLSAEAWVGLLACEDLVRQGAYGVPDWLTHTPYE